MGITLAPSEWFVFRHIHAAPAAPSNPWSQAQPSPTQMPARPAPPKPAANKTTLTRQMAGSETRDELLCMGRWYPAHGAVEWRRHRGCSVRCRPTAIAST